VISLKINDNRPLVTTADAKKGNGLTVDAKKATVADGQTHLPTSTPAVNLGINASVAQTSQMVASTLTHQMTETEALTKIRQLIESGEFKMDFPKIAEQMLKDAVLAIDRPKNN
jgi:anti-sigma28 factor (negative regulator of flagellin synthesis)